MGQDTRAKVTHSKRSGHVWTIVQLTLARDDLERAEALLRLSGAVAITLTDGGDMPLIEPSPGATPVWSRVQIDALFEDSVDTARLRNMLCSALGTQLALSQRTVVEADWQDAWRRHWEPLRFGGRLTVLPTETEAPEDPDDIVIRLTPGLAFGTGQHPTTALCLEWLVAHDLQGKVVLDYGTGSGLLAIAAIKLGARHAYALDIDGQALTACDQNARRNNVRDAVTIGKPADLPEIAADVLLANILAQPLQALARQLPQHITPSGWIVLSGILDHQAAAVMEAYQTRFRFERPSQRLGWVRLVAQLI